MPEPISSSKFEQIEPNKQEMQGPQSLPEQAKKNDMHNLTNAIANGPAPEKAGKAMNQLTKGMVTQFFSKNFSDFQKSNARIKKMFDEMNKEIQK